MKKLNLRIPALLLVVILIMAFAIPAFAALRELWMIGLHAEVMEKNAGCCWYQDDYFDYQLKVFRQWLNRCGLLSE